VRNDPLHWHARPPSIGVFICDDAPDLRDLLAHALASTPGIDVVGLAANGRDGLAGIHATQPDVVILDLSMPGMDGLEVLRRIPAAAPDARVIVFSGLKAERFGPQTRRLGAWRYIEKGTALCELEAAIREAAAANG
jgi:DNA-binding NarL/FixJ family response regulator